MKNSLTSKLFCLLTAICLSNQLMATDLVVAAGGAGGAYATLSGAIAAANSNDRIIVYPQANGASYSENTLTITKSLQILSANEGAFYSVDGNINVAPSSAGISVTIIGMRLLTGGIQSTIASPLGARSTINILNDSLVSGAVTFNHDNYNLTCASNYIGSGVVFRFGKILGNKIDANVLVNTDASVNNPTDTVQIIGNKINFYSASNTGAITWTSTSQFFSIQNNYMNLSYPGNSVNFGVYVSTSKASLAGTNTITNNTVYKLYTIYYGYTVGTNATSQTEIMNNLFVGGLYQYALATSGGNFSIHYNYSSVANAFTGFTNDGTNITATNTTLNSEGLNTNALSNTINGGTTDSAYVDLNLTRNDVGCYGGSISLDNFFPISASDRARVILVTAPRRILVNATINVKAIGFDK